jgi:hypothetical protein
MLTSKAPADERRGPVSAWPQWRRRK